MAGPMTGADADELDRLASRLGDLAGRFGSARNNTGTALRAAPWHGPGAERFRGRWSAEYSRALVDAEHFLREAAQTLHRNAREQRDASGLGLGGSTTGPDGHRPSFLERLIKILKLENWIGKVGHTVIDAIVGAAKNQIVKVRSYIRANGTVVDEYVRWKPGKANVMRTVVGEAGDLEGIAKNVDRFGNALSVVDGGIHGLEQWNRDDGRPLDERIVRTSAVTVAETGIAFGSAAAGAYVGGIVGTAIPIPVVGTVAGAAIGFGVGYGVGWATEKLGVDEKIADAASWTYHEAEKVTSKVSEIGGDVIRGGSHLLDGAANLGGAGLKKLGSIF